MSTEKSKSLLQKALLFLTTFGLLVLGFKFLPDFGLEVNTLIVSTMLFVSSVFALVRFANNKGLFDKLADIIIVSIVMLLTALWILLCTLYMVAQYIWKQTKLISLKIALAVVGLSAIGFSSLVSGLEWVTEKLMSATFKIIDLHDEQVYKNKQSISSEMNF